MKKNVFIYGSIAGLITAVWMLGSVNACYNNPNLEGNMWLGYASMIVAFSLIFVGVKNYRDKNNGGIITFGKAFKIGLTIAFIASTIYVLAWLVDYYCFVPDFMDKYNAHVIAQAKKDGSTLAEINKQQEEMAMYTNMYKNPLGVIMLTYMEIFPVGLVISLISALILKRKPGAEQEVSAFS